MISTAPPMTNAEAAQHIARTLGPVLPICYIENGVCACGGRYDLDTKTMVPHVGSELGKAPISALVRNGVDGATTNSATIDRWFRQHPRAGVALALKPSRIVFVDPDSPAAYAEAIAQGVEGGMLRTSRNDGFLYRRPDDCPVLNITKSADHTDLEVRADGYVVVWNTHQDGSPVRVDLSTHLRPCPPWTVDRLKRKATQKAEQDAVRAARRAERAENGIGDDPPVRDLSERALQRWRGELVVEKNGKLDRSDSLYFIALDLAVAGASEAAIEAAIRERDAALGWEKYTHRPDADERYQEAAERAVAWAVKRGSAPRIRFVSKAAPAEDQAEDELAGLRREVEELRESNRDLLGWVDRLSDLEEKRKTVIAEERAERKELAETIRTMFEVIAITDAQMDARTKLVYLYTGREATSRNSRGIVNLSNVKVAEGTGLTADNVSEIMQDLKAREGVPWKRGVTREWVTVAAGVQEPRSIAQVRVTTKELTFVSVLRAAPAMGGPSEKAQQKKTKAKARAEQSVQARIEAGAQAWGRCSQCDNLEVAVTGACPHHGEIVGETIVRREDFEILNPAFPDSGSGHTRSTVSLVTKRPAMQDSGSGPTRTNGHRAPSVGTSLTGADVSEEVKRRDQNYMGPCPACQTYGLWCRVDGVTRCAGCQAVIHTEAWASDSAPDGRLPGFDPPPPPAVAER